MGLMLDALKLVYESDITDTDALDGAASLLADAIERLGVGAFLALVTRGAGRLAKTGGGARRANQPDTDSSPTRRGKPRGVQGVEFDGTGYRYEMPDRVDTTWEAGPWNADYDHRYSGVGERAVYAGTSPKTAFDEISHYNAEAGRVLVQSQMKLDNALDLTDSGVRQSLGIGLDDITGNNYDITQDIARWARRNGFDGIIAPSARNPGGSNLVVFFGD